MIKKISIIMACSLLSACATPKIPDINTDSDIIVDGTTIGSAPAPKIPDLPENLARKAGPLSPLKNGDKESVTNDLANSSRAYNAISAQLNDLIITYNCVQDAYNNKHDSKKCFDKR